MSNKQIEAQEMAECATAKGMKCIMDLLETLPKDEKIEMNMSPERLRELVNDNLEDAIYTANVGLLILPNGNGVFAVCSDGLVNISFKKEGEK